MANSVLADEIIEALEKIDEFQRIVAEAQKKIAVAKDELAKVQETVRTESAGPGRPKSSGWKSISKTAEAKIPADFRNDYNRVVKSKGADAMAEVQNGFCGGCYQQLTPNNMADLSMSRAHFLQELRPTHLSTGG